MNRWRARRGGGLAAAAIGLLMLLGAGCEGPTDEDNSGVAAYLRANPYQSEARDTPSPNALQISPTRATASIVGQKIVFTASGGYGGYHWGVASEGYGDIRGQEANQAIYTCARVGNNDVIVQDDEGHYAVAHIAPVTDAMTVAPSAVTLSGGALYVSFSVSGGTPPYSWVAGNPALGTVSYAAGSTHAAGYTAVSGAYGQNQITVVDAEGRTASATVTQQP